MLNDCSYLHLDSPRLVKVFKIYRQAMTVMALLLLLIATPGIMLSQELALKSKYAYSTPALDAAQQLYRQKKYPEALAAFEAIIVEAEAQQNYEEVVYAMEKTALALRRLNRYDDATSVLESAIKTAIARLPKNHFLISKVYYTRGTTDHIRQSYYTARNYLDTALIYYNDSKSYDSAFLKRLIEYKYYAYQYSDGSKDTLLKYLSKMEAFEEIQQLKYPNPDKVLLLMQSYPLIYSQAGDFDQALAHAIRAYKFAQENKKESSNRFYAEAHYDLSRVLYFKKNYLKALEVGLSVMPMVENTDRSAMPEYYAFNNLLGVIYMALDDYINALPYFERALARKEIENNGIVQLNRSAFEAQVVMNMGICYSKLENDDKAKELLNKSILLRQEVNSSPNSDFQSHYEALGNFFSKKSNWREALISYDSALRNGLEAYSGEVTAFPSNDHFFSFKDLRTLTKKTESLSKLGNNSNDESLLESARVYAINTSTKLMENREALVASEGKLFLSENFKSLYETGLNICFELFNRTNNPEYFSDALHFARLSKATLFLEQSTEFELVNNNVIPTNLKRAYFESKVKIEGLQKSFNQLVVGSMTSDSILDINEKLMNARKQAILIKDSLKETLSDYGPLEASYSNVLKGTLNINVEEGHLLIEYFFGEDNLYILGVGPESKSFHKIKLDEAFEKALGRTVKLVSEVPNVENTDSGLREFIDDSSLLFDLLIAPVFSDLGEKPNRLVIVPDEFLSRLPFEVLLTEKPSKENAGFDRLPYLIKSFNIKYEFSSALYSNNSSAKPTVSKRFLGVGFKAEKNSSRRAGYGSLPGTEREINFLKSKIEGTYLIGENGGKENFIEKAKEFDILHLAIHGIADSLDRYKSSLIFNGGEGNILNTDDLYLADLNARLAVLSACESGLGSVTKGEGTFSIARGFALVGIPSLVMSLWKVNDQITSELMMSMYNDFIENGTAINESLRLAKLNYLESSDQYSGHPYYWAAFLHLGEDVTLNESQSSMSTNYLSVLLFVLVITLFTYLYIKRKRAK